MTHRKIAIVGMPFDMFRILARGHAHNPDEFELGLQAKHVMAQQLASQSFHANCGTPTFTTRPSRAHKERFELVVTCDCGEELTIIDGLTKESLEPVGEHGAFVPNTTHQA